MKVAKWLTLCVLTFVSLAVSAQDKPANRLSQIQTAKTVRVCIWPDTTASLTVTPRLWC